jgi:uncharacterized protein with von Willebrand factor type A (vWA) domain
MEASTIAELHACALATMVSDPSQVDTFERVFTEMFGAEGPGVPSVTAPQQTMTAEPAETPSGPDSPVTADTGKLPPVMRQPDASSSRSSGEPDEDMPEVPAIRRVASDTERLRATRPRTEVFTFATRLTRLTPFLAMATPETMLAKAGEAAPDWAGGTRIGAALHEFNDRYGARGMARGAVVLIISDGWETGDPAVLGAQMARLHRIAYRIVWANPRTQSDRYRPEVGGMAAAWPYCDAVVSAHNFEALDDLLAALRAPAVRRPPAVPAASDVPRVSSGGTVSAAADAQPTTFSLPLTASLGRRWSPGR